MLRTLLNISGVKEGRIKMAEFGAGVDKSMQEVLDKTKFRRISLKNGGRQSLVAVKMDKSYA